MPELPEVEAIVRRLRPDAVGSVIARVSVLRARSTYPQDPKLLQDAVGHCIEAIERRGKNIVVRLSGGKCIRVHLRMTGILRAIPDCRLYASTARVLFALKDGRALLFEDRRVLGTVHLHSGEELELKLAGLGLDPFAGAFTPEYLIQAAQQSSRPVKILLMNQDVIAGLGNIYAAESLFTARIYPGQPACSVSRPKLRALHAAIQAVLGKAIAYAIRTYESPGGQEMDLEVYDRKGESCNRCGKLIQVIQQAGRTTYFCPRCQRK